ncbi:MauE/DoxX family redox-associated membrane protein [Trichloromonas sp.]|uniref:MauE/DoxX family redox-associated membrane protein n=1 Tax=Trichloromonas sp. TaxID=3069249 RepID=UPI002A3F6633|nr:MauE/DoxX family redox-associated membrane protein [Trichloromonas sp.]
MSRAMLYVYHFCRLALGGVYLYAGVVKSADVVTFARDVANYQLLPYAWNYLAAATLPYVETVAALLLLFNRKVRPAALILTSLTLVFMVALVTVLVRGLDIDCGCFNPSQGHTSAGIALLRDAFLLFPAIVTLRLSGRMSAR